MREALVFASKGDLWNCCSAERAKRRMKGGRERERERERER
jgi:hypothetical protein